jgi:outer membrane protein assembly factor BamA
LGRVFVLLVLLHGSGASPARAAADSPSASNPQAGEAEDTAADSGGKWGKLLPLPIFVTEPAIGEGLGASLIYFHREAKTARPKATTAREVGKTGKRSKPPPTATGVFGFYTNNDSAAAGIGHSNTFQDDNYRLLAAGAEARINSQLYIADQGFDFRLEGSLLYSQVKRRLGREGAFVGLSLSWLDAETRFFSGQPAIDDLDLLGSGFRDAGLALSLLYDTRDNTILPASGFLVDLTGWRYGEAGGDFDYDKGSLRALYFSPFLEKYVLGLRLDASTASGDVPFYAAPYVSLRGIPALRYQGKIAGAVEIEARRRLGDRWSASVFSGAGFVDTGFAFGDTDDDIHAVGIGMRYLAFREQDAWVGVDIARGPEDTAWYIQMGSSW